MRLLALVTLLAATAFVATASADNTVVTYTATQTIPVPPASSFAGSSGGDGWDVSLTPDAVYNVFHHSGSLQVACHLQANAQRCWSTDAKSITQPGVGAAGAGGFSFESQGHPGTWIDQTSGHLYVYATRSDGTGGVVCVDTVNAPNVANPFCGFTQLTGVGEAPAGGYSAIGLPSIVGSRWFAFNYVSGTSPGGPQGTGAQDKLLCFDLTTFAACAGQPYTVDLGSNNNVTVSSSLPSPVPAAIGDEIVIPINAPNGELACFNGAALGNCSGLWPVGVNFSYIGSNGAPFPMLTQNGGINGFCLPASTIHCYDLTGASVDPPPNIGRAILPSVNWNGPGLVIGPRVYVPRWNAEVDCYDYNAQSGCANFPKTVAGLNLLYTVNADPQRPSCIWVNSDSGLQIQNFDAFTGGGCGEGPIRVLASASVVSTPLCTPGSWKSLQITSPARSTYTSGTVAFRDASNAPIPGVVDAPIDANGAVDLTGLSLNTSSGLPQFLITLDSGGGRPQSIVVQLTWTGAFDPSCLTKPGTEVEGAPPSPPSTPPPAAGGPPAVPPKADVQVSVAGPAYVREGATVKFDVTVKNLGPDTATGVAVRAPTVPGATFVSGSTTVGNGCSGTFCAVGTLAPGASAVVTLVYTANQTGPLTLQPIVESDYDPNHSNNNGSTSSPVIAVGAPPPPPPAPSAPGTFNAIGTGTVTINGKAVQPDQLLIINSGDDIDVTDGSITIVTADGSVGTFSSSQPTARRSTSSTARATANLHAEFIITQPTSGGTALLTLAGGSFGVCGTPRSLSAANATPVRQLWGTAKGSFTTKGRFAAATIRGTIWLTQDRCDGTLAQVVDGVVEVADSTLGKTVSVTAGQSYVAPAAAPTAPAAVRGGSTKTQTPAQITQSGLLWGGKVFKTRTAFTTWLKSTGDSWTAFERAHPAQAKALGARG